MQATTIALILAVAGAARAQTVPIESVLTETISAHPADARLMLRLSMFLRTEGRTDEADVWLKAAAEADPTAVADFVSEPLAVRGGQGCGSIGADLTVAGIPQIAFMSHEGAAQNGVSAYGIAATVCNIGDAGVGWVANTPEHPVAAQNIYRYADGRFSQVGISWLKHEFFALASNACCSCTGFMPDQLSVGCSDSFSATVAANQSILGPRFEVNPSTGVFPYPFTSPAIGSSSDRRCLVADDAINPAINPGARYFAEVHYVAPSDAAAGNGNNNAAFRELSFAPSGDGFSALFADDSVPGLPAIKAWPLADPSAVVLDLDIPDDGRFHVGYTVTDNGNGTWHYEYAIHNMNSDRAAQAFSLPIPASVTITNAEFHDVTYHSGEPFDATDWTFSFTGGLASWSTEAFSTNQNANALRWGTLYNFAFDADAPPAGADASITLFKPPSARGMAGVTIELAVPSGAPCPADFDATGSVGAGDLAVLLAQWGSPGTADLDGSGLVGAADLAVLLAAWGDCP